MRNFARKPKATAGAADASQPYLGVRTRAKTLALQRRQSIADASLPPPKPAACYLELRSRRLEKTMQLQNSRILRHGSGLKIGRREGLPPTGRVSSSIEREGSAIGENNLDFEGGESVRFISRESTPCSFIKTADAITTLGSTTKKSCSISLGQSQRPRNEFLTNAPPSHELEEFFDRAEQSVQQGFLEKYNFDFAKEVPLPGRYDHRTML